MPVRSFLKRHDHHLMSSDSDAVVCAVAGHGRKSAILDIDVGLSPRGNNFALLFRDYRIKRDEDAVRLNSAAILVRDFPMHGHEVERHASSHSPTHCTR